MLTASAEQIRAAAAFAEGLGVPHGSVMFRKILLYVELLGEDKIAAKVKYLKSTLGWSDAEVGIALSKDPSVLRRSKNMLQRRSEFLLSELGLEPAYIAHRPAMLTYSLEGRLRPRYYVMKFLKENGLLVHTLILTEKVFMEKYICPHMEAAPDLAEDYAAACRGESPTRFRFASPKNEL
ncbi:hypothetical protein CFC21_086342 [Triticum aestivum]|uniref:Uncharacterized protein n=2 Tax=Triticum aestivum TaxID=4565 RepID=A0A3B6PHI0_WHEAT|nr:hypothetical protein CFC21_086342 [Triticum aestivum]